MTTAPTTPEPTIAATSATPTPSRFGHVRGDFGSRGSACIGGGSFGEGGGVGVGVDIVATWSRAVSDATAGALGPVGSGAGAAQIDGSDRPGPRGGVIDVM